MLREEAIRELKKQFVGEYYRQREAKDRAIKALEQEPILDKIRAEIEREEKWLAQAGYNAYNVDIAFKSLKNILRKSEDD